MASKRSQNFLVISDLQLPFEAEYALDFCKEIKKECMVDDENILCVGDEVDQYFGSQYQHDPDALHTPDSEIRETINKLKPWYKEFPKMRIAESNHGERWKKRAFGAGIPSIFMRRYQEVIEAPMRWKWQRRWMIEGTHKNFMLTHGMGYSGVFSHRQMAINNGISVVHGHLTHAGISHIKSDNLDIWGMCVSCLIDPEKYAFQYGLDSKFKPNIGIGLVLDGGRTPIWIPYPYKR